jgi:hypothetical protein
MGNIHSAIHLQQKDIIKYKPIFITKHILRIKKWSNDELICCDHPHTNVLYASKIIDIIPKYSILYLKSIKKKTLYKIIPRNNYDYIVEYNKKNYIISNSIIQFDKQGYSINLNCLKKK